MKMDSKKSPCGCGCIGMKQPITKSAETEKKAEGKEAVEKKVKETK
jgi:hypothetical protein